jgi:inhibitor of KinA sporulation pathway (predicted exonuclease)
MKYCVIDLECTCWDREDSNKQPHETIEIGAILLDENYSPIKEFDIFVKPLDNFALTEYCTNLTSITQKDVDSAPTLSVAISRLKEWLGNTDDITFCSWGYFDKEQLLEDCKRNMIDYPFNEDHINVKARFSKVMERTRKVSLKKALRILGIQFEGTPHRGGDDAKMIAKVFKFIMEIERKNK